MTGPNRVTMLHKPFTNKDEEVDRNLFVSLSLYIIYVHLCELNLFFLSTPAIGHLRGSGCAAAKVEWTTFNDESCSIAYTKLLQLPCNIKPFDMLDQVHLVKETSVRCVTFVLSCNYTTTNGA